MGRSENQSFLLAATLRCVINHPTMAVNKTVSIPQWGYEAMTALRDRLKVRGVGALPAELRAHAEERLAQDGEAFSRGYVLALAAWSLNELARLELEIIPGSDPEPRRHQSAPSPVDQGETFDHSPKDPSEEPQEAPARRRTR
jgi:hypothetical protein